MKTADLASALKLTKSSLLSIEFVPVLTHFCFVDGGVYAYNDISAVFCALDHNISAAVKGDTLLGVINTLGAEVTLEPTKEGGIKLVSGKAKIELAALPPEAFLFEHPEEDAELEIKMTPEFMAGLQRVAETVGDNALHREFTAVCFHVNKSGALQLYSFDDVRMSRFVATETFKGIHDEPKTWLMPGSSCLQLVELYNALKDGGKFPSFCLGTNWCWFSLGSVMFYSKLMTDTPPDYEKEIAAVCPPTKALVKVPAGLAEALARAVVLTEKEARPAVKMKCDGKTLTVSVGKENARGNFTETLPLAGAEVDLTFQPKKLAAALLASTSLCFHQLGLRVDDGAYTCLVAPLTSANTEEE